jgi:hypothetical protein
MWLDGETIMNEERELTIDELDAVSGGAFPIVVAQMALLRGSGDGVDHPSLSIVKLLDAATP